MNKSVRLCHVSVVIFSISCLSVITCTISFLFSIILLFIAIVFGNIHKIDSSVFRKTAGPVDMTE